MNTNKTLKTNNPNEPATDAVNRTAQEILAAFAGEGFGEGELLLRAGRGDRHARPPGGQGRPGGVQGHQGRYCGSQLQDESLKREDRGRRLG